MATLDSVATTGLRHRKGVSRLASGLVLGLVTGLGLLVATAVLPQAVGFYPLVVVSGSMEPTLNVGDIAVARQVDPATLELGDVITYNSLSGLITHRIIGIEVTTDGPLFSLRGDANRTADPKLLPAERIVAKVVYRLPWIGYLVHYANSNIGRMLFVAVPLLLLGLLATKSQIAKHRARPVLTTSEGDSGAD